MECWSVGVLECWSVGVLECWSTGVLEYWSTGVLEYWSTGVLEYWSTGVLEYWSTGVLECWSAGVLDAAGRLRSNPSDFAHAKNLVQVGCTCAVDTGSSCFVHRLYPDDRSPRAGSAGHCRMERVRLDCYLPVLAANRIRRGPDQCSDGKTSGYGALGNLPVRDSSCRDKSVCGSNSRRRSQRNGSKSSERTSLTGGRHGSFLMVPHPYRVYDALRPRVLSRRR